MKQLPTIFLVLIIFLSGCAYSGIFGKVIDRSTGEPIEGALVVVEWVKVRGLPGLQYHEPHKLIETLTDKDGTFNLSGTFGLLLDPPTMVIYKEGYIPWRNDSIFPSLNTVKDHEWNNNETYKLETTVITTKYTLDQLHGFLTYGIRASKEVPLYSALEYKISLEQHRRATTQIPLDFKGLIVDAETNEPIEGAIILAIGYGIGYTPKVNAVTEGISDKRGNVRIVGNFPMLERPPYILVYKKGYCYRSSWSSWGVTDIQSEELKKFPWKTGYVFRLNKWHPGDPHINHFYAMQSQAAQAEQEGKPLLMNSILWEKEAK